MNDNQKWEIIQGDRMPPADGPKPKRTSPPPRSIPAWGRMRRLPLMGTPRTNAPGPAGRQSGCMRRGKPASPVHRCVCSSTGGSFPQPPMPFNGRGGSGVVPLSGIRATAVLRRAASASRRSTLSGVPTEICLSAVRCPACQECSNMVIHRAAFTLRRNPYSLCGTL